MKNSIELLNLRSQSTDQLKKLYWCDNLSHQQISKIYKVSRCAIQNVYKLRGIKPRTNAESQTAINISRTKAISYDQNQLILGSLLGDACLSYEVYKSNKTGQPLSSYKLEFAHSHKYLNYLLHKHEILRPLGIKKQSMAIGSRISGYGSKMFFFYFCHTPTLKNFALICHDKHHQKTISDEWVSKIEWPALAYWFQDDGSTLINKNRRTLRFYTNNFSIEDIQKLQQMFLRFNLHPTITKTKYGKKDRGYVLVINRQKEVDYFLDNIKKHIVPSMEYKNRRTGIYDEKKGRRK